MMIQFDFGTERAWASLHLRDLGRGVSHSHCQPHGPSHCTTHTANSFLPLCCLLRISFPIPPSGSGVHFRQVASAPPLPRTDFPLWPCLSQPPPFQPLNPLSHFISLQRPYRRMEVQELFFWPNRISPEDWAISAAEKEGSRARFFPECHFKTLDTQKGVSTENAHTVRLM